MTRGAERFEEFVRKTREEGRSEGRTEGAIASLARLVARKLGRPLSAVERRTLAER